jgi:hypothetical protein
VQSVSFRLLVNRAERAGHGATVGKGATSESGALRRNFVRSVHTRETCRASIFSRLELLFGAASAQPRGCLYGAFSPLVGRRWRALSSESSTRGQREEDQYAAG